MASNQGGNKGKQSGTSNRGFASMDPEKQRAIASEGGRAAHASGNAHEFTSEEARAAGKLSHGGNRQSGATAPAAKPAGNPAGAGNLASSPAQGANRADSGGMDSGPGGKQR
ncbi:KGG domain-containing protein [Massilia cavernae]|uniref:General stress protein n=1 Tax=Massilia cavernae TaxID=2320864 RepID=A0A418XR51_9BURK|nr:KGG domain-containing protein [Massilia cavernae]RJG14961.1 hypothetical protein D3872_15510 [Massilia cavernae]